MVWFFLDSELKNDEDAKFHVKQAMVLMAVSFLLQLVLQFVPYLGTAVSFASLILGIIGISNAWQGKRENLPFIGKFADRIRL